MLGHTHATLENFQTIVDNVELPPSHHLSSDANDADPITPSQLHDPWSPYLTKIHSKRDEGDDPNCGEHADTRKRVKTQALLFRHFWTRWQKEYLTVLCEFHCSTASSTETVGDGDITLIHP